MKIYTRSGDDGNTSLAGGQRVPKFHPRIEAFGTVDELISWIGLLRDFTENESQEGNYDLHSGSADEMCSHVLQLKRRNGKAAEYLPDKDCISIS